MPDLNPTPESLGPGDEALLRAEEIARRVLDRQGTALQSTAAQSASARADAGPHEPAQVTLEKEARAATRRSDVHTAELEDVTEVEYRDVRLERVILVGLRLEGTREQAEDSLRELQALSETAGAQVLDRFLQNRDQPDVATYLGRGKASELRDLVKSLRADTVIVDGELSPSQRRGLEDVVKVKVVDRTAVILDIFAQHAKSREGKAQVELAQLEYLLPRLRGWGESMSRQAGGRVAGGAGIGSRGPGETKIELDRRRIRTRMSRLRRQLAQLAPARQHRRAQRRRGKIPSATIVGYTNAGKSTLLNQLTDAGVLVEDALFATLDPTVRRATTPDGRVYTLTDTVGFVRNLPTHLVEAFRSTLEEAAEADLLLHVVDAAHPDPKGQIAAVREVLGGIAGADEIPELIILNKCDLAEPERLAALRASFPEAEFVSAQTGEGIEDLKNTIARRLPRPQLLLDVFIPMDQAALLSEAHEHGEVLEEEWTGTGIHVVARVDEGLGRRLSAANLH